MSVLVTLEMRYAVQGLAIGYTRVTNLSSTAFAIGYTSSLAASPLVLLTSVGYTRATSSLPLLSSVTCYRLHSGNLSSTAVAIG